MPPKYETKSFRLCRCCYKWRCQCLIPRVRKPHPAFNSGTKQRDTTNLHPKLVVIPASPPVGSYDPRLVERIPGTISWKKQQDAEDFSATMGGQMIKEIAFQRFLMRTGLGPGTHEILRWPENVLRAPCKTLREDVNFGTVPQFKPAYKSTTPGPGYTLRTHNPFYYLEQKKLRGFSQVPTFEFDGLAPRFQETRKSWSLACNRYNVKYPTSLQAFLEKVTSKRGPYNLFTGPRDESTIRGYWARVKVQDYDWAEKLPSEMEKLSSKSNYFKGRWSTTPRFTKKPVSRMMLQDINTCYKDPDQPGPSHYYFRTPGKPSSLKKYPFDSNIDFVRPLPSSDFLPGPGRYKIKEDYRIKGSGWTCVFKSKVPRTISNFIAPLYSNF